MTALELDEDEDVPTLLVAVLLNVYDVLLVRPVTTHDPLAPVTVHCAPPGLAVTV